ncbi:hypothetical protein M9H77_22731 [Catharanthus roseus]|uniref:Uncharacterized protein n=1 Tax=Catharanthus roseus TaxID=4058 RepID=A0ACC0ATZ0_CATRO|nr:hypothetical protein M9H77_22731 [Catharanthus roseus]
MWPLHEDITWPPCSCELIIQFDHMLPIQLSDIEGFWKILEIESCHPSAQHKDMDSEMHVLTDLLHQISIGLISKVRGMRGLVKGVLSSVLHEDPGMPLTSPPEVAVTKGRKKMNSTKRDKSYWEQLSISHRKIQKSSGSGSSSGLGSDPSPCSTFPYTDTFLTFIYPFIANWKNVIGDGNYGYWIVADFVFGDEHQWPEDSVFSDECVGETKACNRPCTEGVYSRDTGLYLRQRMRREGIG